MLAYQSHDATERRELNISTRVSEWGMKISSIFVGSWLIDHPRLLLLRSGETIKTPFKAMSRNNHVTSANLHRAPCHISSGHCESWRGRWPASFNRARGVDVYRQVLHYGKLASHWRPLESFALRSVSVTRLLLSCSKSAWVVRVNSVSRWKQSKAKDALKPLL